MDEYCPACRNFMTIIEKQGAPWLVCELDKIEIRKDAPTVLVIFETGNESQQAEEDPMEQHIMVNLTYERTMARSTKKCHKCKSNTVYRISPKTNLYIYGCPKCHEVVQ